MKNYYKKLEVNQKASKEVIEKAYKVLIKKYHPDGQVSSKKYECDEKMKEINEAYEILSNPFLRSQYDIEIEKEQKRQNLLEYERIRKEQQENTNNNINNKQHEVQEVEQSDFWSIVNNLKKVLKDRKARKTMRNIAKKDIIAILLTIVVIVLLGIILWFIPFTNQWIRELLFENPIFNAIGALFSKK